jgi:hypothetical protein
MKFEADAPVIGLVLQKSHLVTGDEGHYSGVVSDLESRGAKVRRAPRCSGACTGAAERRPRRGQLDALASSAGARPGAHPPRPAPPRPPGPRR